MTGPQRRENKTHVCPCWVGNREARARPLRVVTFTMLQVTQPHAAHAHTLRSQLELSRRLEGFRSRWRTLEECMYFNARITCCAVGHNTQEVHFTPPVLIFPPKRKIYVLTDFIFFSQASGMEHRLVVLVEGGGGVEVRRFER